MNRRSDTACVRVDIRGDSEVNDLISCLSQQLFLHETDDTSNHLSLVEPSDVVAFQLVRHNVYPQGAVPNREPFHYPRCVYLDQFLRENAELANHKRARQRKMAEDIQAMVQKREKLTYHEVRSYTWAPLRLSIPDVVLVLSVFREEIFSMTWRRLCTTMKTLQQRMGPFVRHRSVILH